MRRIRLGDSEVNVYAWADPTTGIVVETVYPRPGKDADRTSVCVWDADTHDAYLHRDPWWFPVTARNTYGKVDSGSGCKAPNWGQYDGACLDCDGPAPHVRLSYCDACLPALDYDPEPF